MAADAQQRIEAYLGRLRTRLRGVNEEELREIVEELRSHILDAAGASGAVSPGAVDAALAGLGTPEELASQYLTDNLLARAEASRSPLQILRSLFRWGSLSIAGLFVLLGSLTGYFLGGAFLVVALLKPFHPQSAGLWASRDGTGDLALSLRLGFGGVPAGSHEVLGWWMVPIGLAVGGGLVMLTTHVALLCVRVYRRSRVLPTK